MMKNNKAKREKGKILWRSNIISIICTLLAPILSILVNIYYVQQIRLEDKKEIEANSKIRNVQNIMAQISGRYYLSRRLLSAYYSGDSAKIIIEKNNLSSSIIDWNI